MLLYIGITQKWSIYSRENDFLQNTTTEFEGTTLVYI